MYDKLIYHVHSSFHEQYIVNNIIFKSCLVCEVDVPLFI